MALCELYPLDKAKNADGKRRLVEPTESVPQAMPAPSGIAPLLRELMENYAATGLPPAYVPLRAASDEDDQ